MFLLFGSTAKKSVFPCNFTLPREYYKVVNMLKLVVDEASSFILNNK
jgi:hypothetical protein